MTARHPPGATHALGCHYYRKRVQGGADVWCRERGAWKHMEDKSTKKMLKEAVRL